MAKLTVSNIATAIRRVDVVMIYGDGLIRRQEEELDEMTVGANIGEKGANATRRLDALKRAQGFMRLAVDAYREAGQLLKG